MPADTKAIGPRQCATELDSCRDILEGHSVKLSRPSLHYNRDSNMLEDARTVRCLLRKAIGR